MRTLKLLIVTQYFYPETFKINDLALHFKKKGHNVSVLTGIPNYPGGKYYPGYGIFRKRFEIYNGIKIYRSLLIPRMNSGKVSLILNYFSFAFFSSIKILTLKSDYDLIFVYEPSPITVGIPAIVKKIFIKSPMIFWVTDLWPESVTATTKLPSFINKLLVAFINPIVKIIYKNSDKILITSKGFLPSIINKNINKNKIIYFPQWAEKIFKPIEPSSNIDLVNKIPKNSFKIMFAGNIGEAQDFPSIIQCAKLLKHNKKIHWIILGNGRKLNWTKRKVKQYDLEDNFHLLGSFPLIDMPGFYSYADCMLLSLKKEYIFSITVPAKIQSYMACKKPILAMIDGEAANIVNESSAGLTCASEDYKSLAKNISEISNYSKSKLNKIGQNGLEFYNMNFNRKILMHKLENLFYELA